MCASGKRQAVASEVNAQKGVGIAHILPDFAVRELVDAATRARQMPKDSQERKLEIEWAIDAVRSYCPGNFK